VGVLPARENLTAVAASAALASRGENSRLGLCSRKTGVHRGFAACNSRTALGLRERAGKTRVRSRCTGKERDSETGLDYFGARYYTSNMGRFMTPDWADKPTAIPYSEFGDPQSLNLYEYVRNNPLSHADADGHCCDITADAIVFVARHPELATAVAGIATKVEAAASTAGAIATRAVSTAVATPALVISYLVSPGTGGANEKNDTIQTKTYPPLPANPGDLTEKGYHDTSHPQAASAGHQTFENPQTGDKVRFDKAKAGAPAGSWEEVDHYHRYNPNATGKQDEYLDEKGQPVPRGSDASHLLPKIPPPPGQPDPTTDKATSLKGDGRHSP
jgi:RHS repeat-associated protein